MNRESLCGVLDILSMQVKSSACLLKMSQISVDLKAYLVCDLSDLCPHLALRWPEVLVSARTVIGYWRQEASMVPEATAILTAQHITNVDKQWHTSDRERNKQDPG